MSDQKQLLDQLGVTLAEAGRIHRELGLLLPAVVVGSIGPEVITLPVKPADPPIIVVPHGEHYIVDLPWPDVGSRRIAPVGFGPNNEVSIRFTTPDRVGMNAYGRIFAAETLDLSTFRTAMLSTEPGDFTVGVGAPAVTETTTVSVSWSLGPNSSIYAALQPNTSYYFNIANRSFGQVTCVDRTCRIFVELQKPAGF